MPETLNETFHKEEIEEMSSEEKIKNLEQQVENLTSIVQGLLEDRKQLQRTGVLNKDPETPEGTY